MEAEFAQNQYPDGWRRDMIAREIGFTEARIQVWFQNRRARHNKRKRMSHDQTEADDNVLKRHKTDEDVPYVPMTTTVRTVLRDSLPAAQEANPMTSQRSTCMTSQPSMRVAADSSQNEASDIVKHLFRFSKRYSSHSLSCENIVKIIMPPMLPAKCVVSKLSCSECRNSDVSARKCAIHFKASLLSKSVRVFPDSTSDVRDDA
ncbi:paired mesoderm homeobox protein 1-like isoform X2 [Dreissena polymorpha]|nr:paired mesoderm homeobox protein 1-like isoform X2 [Dreissena polymorpha]